MLQGTGRAVNDDLIGVVRCNFKAVQAQRRLPKDRDLVGSQSALSNFKGHGRLCAVKHHLQTGIGRVKVVALKDGAVVGAEEVGPI